MNESIIRVNTPIGILTAEPSQDPNYPGLWINLERPGTQLDLQLALIEYSYDDNEIVTRVWGNALQEDYTMSESHENVDEYFEKWSEEADTNERKADSCNMNERDRILFGTDYDEQKYKYGGTRSFDHCTSADVERLILSGFLDPEDRQNRSPRAIDFLQFMKEHEDFEAFGYAVAASRDDCRVTIEGLTKTKNVTHQDKIDFDVFSAADEYDNEDGCLRCWYD